MTGYEVKNSGYMFFKLKGSDAPVFNLSQTGYLFLQLVNTFMDNAFEKLKNEEGSKDKR